MGMFCVQLGYTPGQYWDLTEEERQAILRAWKQIHKGR